MVFWLRLRREWEPGSEGCTTLPGCWKERRFAAYAAKLTATNGVLMFFSAIFLSFA